MIILDKDSKIENRKSIVTIGKFDGLHLGHIKIIDQVISVAEEYAREEAGIVKTVVSFVNHPAKLLLPDFKGVLMSETEKTELLYGLGIDYYCALVFDESLRDTKASDFFEEYIVGRWKACSLVVGDDFCFGKGRKGNIPFLQEKCKEKGIGLYIVSRKQYEGEAISSSRIRKCLSDGDITAANKMSGHPYTIKGMVVKGAQIGRTLGFPTLNIYPDTGKFLPKFGVYAASVTVDGKMYKAVANLGIKPTLNNVDRPLLETHLLGFEGDLYDRFMEVRLESFIRPEQRFESLEALKMQMNNDLSKVKSKQI